MPRVKRTNDEWRALLAEQRASGQTQPDWCKANGVNLYTLRGRASRLKKMDKASAPAPEHGQPGTVSAGWMEVTPERLPMLIAGISIERGGFVITLQAGFDAGLLVEVLRAVSRACC